MRCVHPGNFSLIVLYEPGGWNYLGALPGRARRTSITMQNPTQRLIQVGAVVLALGMLGGYVVYSQRSHQPQQASSSKSKQVIVGTGVTTNATPAPGPVMMGSSKGGIVMAGSPSSAVITSGVIVLSGTHTSPVVTWSAATTNPAQVSSMMMAGSKAGRIEITGPLVQPADQVRTTGGVSPLMMTGSKSAAIVRPGDLHPIAAASTGAVLVPLMPGSKSLTLTWPLLSQPTNGVATNSPIPNPPANK